jgi:hypothetical protein
LFLRPLLRRPRLRQRLEAGDLVGLLAYVELGQGQAAEVVAGGE